MLLELDGALLPGQVVPGRSASGTILFHHSTERAIAIVRDQFDWSMPHLVTASRPTSAEIVRSESKRHKRARGRPIDRIPPTATRGGPSLMGESPEKIGAETGPAGPAHCRTPRNRPRPNLNSGSKLISIAIHVHVIFEHNSSYSYMRTLQS